MAVCKGGILILLCLVDYMGPVEREQAVCVGEAEFAQLPTRVRCFICLSASRVLERDRIHYHEPDSVQEAMGTVIWVMLLRAERKLCDEIEGREAAALAESFKLELKRVGLFATTKVVCYRVAAALLLLKCLEACYIYPL